MISEILNSSDEEIKIDLANIDLDKDDLNPELECIATVPQEFRRWNEVNFCRRLRKMRKAFLEDSECQFNYKLDIDSVI